MAATGKFRRYLPGPNHPPVQGIASQDAYSHGDLVQALPHIREVLYSNT